MAASLLWLRPHADAIQDHETLCRETLPFRTLVPKKLALFGRFFYGERYARLQRQMGELRDMHRNYEVLTEHGLNLCELNREIRIEIEQRDRYWERVWMGMFGGLALLVPMVLMLEFQDWNIVTTFLFTALFIGVLAVGGKSLRGKDVLTATAAYAAVLVMFVGTSMSEPGSGNADGEDVP